jgi:hypothetical protein
MKRIKKRIILYLSLILLIVLVIFGILNNTLTGNVINNSNKKIVNSILIYFFILIVLIIFVIILELENIVKPKPGAGIRGDYIPLREILDKGSLVVNKVPVKFEKGVVYRKNVKNVYRPVQGLKIEDDKVVFLGQHFTSQEAARIMREREALEIKNLFDPYVYLTEPLNLDSPMITEQRRRHILGAQAANYLVEVQVRYPIDKVFLKIEPGRPTHYAIDGDITLDNLIRRKGNYISVREI